MLRSAEKYIYSQNDTKIKKYVEVVLFLLPENDTGAISDTFGRTSQIQAVRLGSFGRTDKSVTEKLRTSKETENYLNTKLCHIKDV